MNQPNSTALDDVINSLYATYTGIEIAESIGRYRKRIELAKKEKEELEQLKALTEKHSGLETIGSDSIVVQSNENELPPLKRGRPLG
jgi:hypothetical protein